MGNALQLIKSCEELHLECYLMPAEEAKKYVAFLLEKYRVGRTTGHLAIWHDTVSVPLEPHEFSYSDHLTDEPAFVFFDQHNEKNVVVVIHDGKKLGSVFGNAAGMEYFVSNKNGDYLLAVNWYVIEGAGTAKEWLEQLGNG